MLLNWERQAVKEDIALLRLQFLSYGFIKFLVECSLMLVGLPILQHHLFCIWPGLLCNVTFMLNIICTIEVFLSCFLVSSKKKQLTGLQNIVKYVVDLHPV